MRCVLLGLAVFAVIPMAHAAHLDVDRLLREIIDSQGVEGKINRQREARFLANKDQQSRLLAESRKAFDREDRAGRDLKSRFETNEAALRELETRLNEKAGILGEMFGVARLVAGDLRVELDSSLVSAQFSGRSQILADTADSKELPTIEQLEQLWYLLQQEMTEGGKIVTFPAQVLSASGEARQADVTRIGLFNLLADGHYLRYIPETGRMVELARQPAPRYLELLNDLESGGLEQVKIAIDPTRGVILGMLVQVPNAIERIEQGGIIGYIILILGIFGLVVVAVRIGLLSVSGRRIQAQLQDTGHPKLDNPLGRVLAVSKENTWENQESLELLIDEAVTREIPALESGQSMVKLLASVAPLLGLLGTVTGMIATFQSISLFGTGDPKLMAAGISQALVTTMLGLIAAIPLLFLHSLLVARSKNLVQILDEQSVGLVSRLIERNDHGNTQ